MISKKLSFVNTKGSSFALPAHGWVGARATSSLAAHFALRNTASNSAEKKGSPSEGVAEGGGWGEEFRHARAVVRQQADKLRCFRRLGIKTSKQNNFQFLLKEKFGRAGVKKLKENCFALLAEVRRAETRSGVNRAFFVQNRFELRSVIATNSDILKIEGHLIARSPRLRRGYARIFPCISELNQKGGQIQIQFFGKANGGSACEARNKQSLFPIFSFPPLAEYKASFFNPALLAKGD